MRHPEFTRRGAPPGPWRAVTGLVFAVMGFFTGWTWYAAAAAILIVPLASIGAALLALCWNRHR